MNRITYACPEDFPRLAELEKLCFSQPWSEEAFLSFAANGGVLTVSRENGSVSGYLGAVFAADEGEIANVAVAPEARRRGIASRLLDDLEEKARPRGVKTLYLDVRVSNAGAIALYEKKGFYRVGLRKGFYRSPGEDAFVYRKDLV